MSLDYFTRFWRRLDARNDERVFLMRGADGSVLARYPEPRDARRQYAQCRPALLAATAGGATAGPLVPGPHEAGSFHRIGDLPAYVAVAYRDAVILDQWRDRLLTMLPFFAAAFLALLSILLLGRRLAGREAIARAEIIEARAMLAATNTSLERRVQERTADLQETNEEVQRFAYIVSHDLRAPLVNIMGFTAELDGLREPLFAAGTTADERAMAKGDFNEAIGFIQSSIDKMDRLIKAILTLSRQGQRKLKSEPLDMDALMRSIIDGVAHRVMQGGVTVTLEALPPLVADRVAVEQIFANLIDNAVKYLRSDVPGLITIGGSASATTVTYTVSDNGRGIEAKDSERVFELFRRAGRQDTAGEGIGLANVRSLVRRLQGTIALDSQPGLYCAFTVTLPKFGADSDA